MLVRLNDMPQVDISDFFLRVSLRFRPMLHFVDSFWMDLLHHGEASSKTHGPCLEMLCRKERRTRCSTSNRNPQRQKPSMAQRFLFTSQFPGYADVTIEFRVATK